MEYRELVITEDGSASIYVPALKEHYHSHFGAKQESQHIFINSALAQLSKESITILEYGFGTGLNALMTYDYAKANNKTIHYYGLEKYPLEKKEYSALNYDANSTVFIALHQLEWEFEAKIDTHFYLKKIQIDFRKFPIRPLFFDIVYFDAFAPDIQPHLWTITLFENIYASMKPGGIFITYTVKGIVRRLLKKVGFKVEKIAGPPGKREITRAWKE